MFLVKIVAFFGILAVSALFLFLIWVLFKRSKSIFETIQLGLSALFGLLLFLVGLYSGVSLPELVLLSIDGTGGNFAKLLTYFFPAVVGFIASWLLLSLVGRIEEGNQLASNFLVMLMSLVSLVSLQIAVLVLISGTEDRSLVLTNVSFMMGIIAVLIFDARLKRIFEQVLSRDEHTIQTEDVAAKNWRNDL